MASSKQFNVGIIGYGLSAKVFHIPFIDITPGLVLHSIVQRNPVAGNSAPADHPTAKHYTTTDALFADADVDVVIVGTPPNTHFALAKAALEAGKHVLVEKPFVPTSAEAETLAALAKEKGKVLCVYQNRRWDQDFLTVRKLLAEGTLGRVVEFETHFDRYRMDKPVTWKGTLGMDQGGGVLFDLGVHLLDQVYVLFGMPDTVSAQFIVQREGRLVSGRPAKPEDEPDSISLVLGYRATGLLVYVRAGVLSVEKRQPRFWVRGSKGTYHKAGLDVQEDQLRLFGVGPSDAKFGHEDPSTAAGQLCLMGEDGSVSEQAYPSVEPETYRAFYAQFAKALETGREEDVPVPASQAAQVLKIIEMARGA